MDFTPTEEQAAAADLAARILADHSTPERLTAAGTGSDAGLWKELCAAGLVGAVADTGLLGLVLMLEEQGRVTAQVPFAASCVYGLLAVAAHGSPEQRERLLPGIIDGTVVVTGAIAHPEALPPTETASGPETASASETASAPATISASETASAPANLSVPVSASPSASAPVAAPLSLSGTLTGVLPVVPWLRDATHVLVADGRRRLWLVRTAEAAASEPVELTAPWSAGRLTLDGTPAEALGAAGAYDDLLATARTAFAGLQAGVCAGSLARAVEHTNTREQFGQPLAARQGVQLRAADAYMDTEAIRVTAYEAAWRRDEGLPYVTHALTAAWWASEAGRRVVDTGQHLHGGAGADLGHPVHRHFLWGRQLDAYLGCGGELLQELGELIANGKVET
ncbi:acyl-CoA dehydrogenase family protein [Streptomyces sp. NPDC026665]|uniref:acyl-CoA dehydrogenase family protein n=1 Tax=Streptomyces sp. NPDC026665 TaxID=3154798 RepID=UPI0033F0EE46